MTDKNASLTKFLDPIVIFLGIVLLGGVIFNFVNVVMRYGFGRTFSWSEEVLVFGLIFTVMIGSIVITALNEHLKVDILLSLMNNRLQSTIKIASQLAVAGVFLFLAIQSQKIVWLMMGMGQTSVAARIPMWIPHGFLLVSFSLSVLAALWSAWREMLSLRAGVQSSTTPTNLQGGGE